MGTRIGKREREALTELNMPDPQYREMMEHLERLEQGLHDIVTECLEPGFTYAEYPDRFQRQKADFHGLLETVKALMQLVSTMKEDTPYSLCEKFEAPTKKRRYYVIGDALIELRECDFRKVKALAKKFGYEFEVNKKLEPAKDL